MSCRSPGRRQLSMRSCRWVIASCVLIVSMLALGPVRGAQASRHPPTDDPVQRLGEWGDWFADQPDQSDQSDQTAAGWFERFLERNRQAGSGLGELIDLGVVNAAGMEPLDAALQPEAMLQLLRRPAMKHAFDRAPAYQQTAFSRLFWYYQPEPMWRQHPLAAISQLSPDSDWRSVRLPLSEWLTVFELAHGSQLLKNPAVAIRSGAFIATRSYRKLVAQHESRPKWLLYRIFPGESTERGWFQFRDPVGRIGGSLGGPMIIVADPWPHPPRQAILNSADTAMPLADASLVAERSRPPMDVAIPRAHLRRPYAAVKREIQAWLVGLVNAHNLRHVTLPPPTGFEPSDAERLYQSELESGFDLPEAAELR